MMRLFRSWPLVARLAALSGTLLAVACAVAPKPTPPPASAPAPATAIPLAPPQFNSGDSRFDAFLIAARKQALAEGIRPDTFDRATAGLKPIPGILNMNANQPEFTRPVWQYLDSAVSARRIRDAQAMLARYGDVLARIEAQSGVSRQILVAVWGMETDYGAASGSYPLFAALATLAYDGPRASYARPEFFAALKIYQQQNYALSEMTGSWAGAFGQTQFTPTTFLKFATDGDGDGRIDLWQSPADALASAARLLAERGWKTGAPWGYEVRLPKGFPYEQADTETRQPVSHWRAEGVKTAAGHSLPPSQDDAAIYLPAGAKGPAFILFPNFSVILKYNNAASYALAVGLLADRMAGAGPVRHNWPRDERPLSRDERVRFQQELAAAGFDPGPADGILGRGTRAALRQYQKAQGLPADGFATADLLQRLDGAR
jgi:membrane-bound lytic murein transglycosylase B